MNWKDFKGCRPVIIEVLTDQLSGWTEELHLFSVRLPVPSLQLLQTPPRTTLSLCCRTRPHGDRYQDSGLLDCDGLWSVRYHCFGGICCLILEGRSLSH
jgi:hypothetical protein